MAPRFSQQSTLPTITPHHTHTKHPNSNNAIDLEGTKALAAALTVNTSLKSLILSDNYIGAAGAAALGEALVGNNSIVELTIRGNDLGDEGIEALATALMVSYWLPGGRGLVTHGGVCGRCLGLEGVVCHLFLSHVLMSEQNRTLMWGLVLYTYTPPSSCQFTYSLTFFLFVGSPPPSPVLYHSFINTTHFMLVV